MESYLKNLILLRQGMKLCNEDSITLTTNLSWPHRGMGTFKTRRWSMFQFGFSSLNLTLDTGVSLHLANWQVYLEYHLADKNTVEKNIVSYARMLIEMPILKKLPNTFTLRIRRVLSNNRRYYLNRSLYSMTSVKNYGHEAGITIGRMEFWNGGQNQFSLGKGD